MKNATNNTAVITGKATTLADLKKQVNALNSINAHCEPTADELAFYQGKVEAAAKMLCEQYRAERISELLAMGNGSKMWAEFLAHRECKSVNVKFDRKVGAYAVKEEMRGRVSYPELNSAYVEAECKRKDAAGEVYDVADVTIASDHRFNTYAPLFFNDCYKRFIDHNLGKTAAGEKAYTLKTKKGADVKGEAPSINQLVRYLNEIVGYLLPDDLKVNMVKADVRKLGVALSNATKTEFKMKGNGHAFNWLLNVIQERIENKAATVITENSGLAKVKQTEEKAEEVA